MKTIGNVNDEVLHCLLGQLVQALKNELNYYNPLVSLLITRALADLKTAIILFWQLRVSLVISSQSLNAF